MTNCIEKTRKDGLSRWEEESEIIFVNKNNDELTIIEIDGCFVKGKINKRCDFMVQHEVINYYIELKAKKWKKAVVQIAKSINTLNKKNFGDKKCKAIIVRSNQVPKYKIIKRARAELKELLESDAHCPIIIKNSPYPHKFS